MSEITHLWQPKWNENQTVLVAAMHTLDRETQVSLKVQQLGAEVYGL